MTDNEIIKALECCSKNHSCGECPNYHKVCEGDATAMIINALDLISRQKEEIEALIAGQETLQKYIANQKAEIERLKGENEKQRLIVESIDDNMFPLPFETDYDKAIKTAKAEAIKEFWEELQRVIVINNTHDGYMDLAIDWNCLLEDGNEIVKEMAGDSE